MATTGTQYVAPLVSLLVFNGAVVRQLRRAASMRASLTTSTQREHATARMMVLVVIGRCVLC